MTRKNWNTRQRVQRATKEPTKQPRFTMPNPGAFFLSTLHWVKSLCESEPEYSPSSTERDKWLTKVWKLEPHLAGVIHSVVSIDTNRGWSLEGGRNQVMRYSQMMHEWASAPGVRGWRPGIASASTSFYTADMGGIVELGRDSESGPVRGLYHVDPTHCKLNGNPEAPLTYTPGSAAPGQPSSQDWAVSDYMRVASQISIEERFNGLGYCALSRCIELAKIMVAVYEHDREQLGAKAPKGLLLLNGVSENQWDDAMEGRKERMLGEDYDYFDAVAVLASSGMDTIKAELIALSSLPQGFNLQQFTGMLIYGYALCFGYDPSEFYPVQFGSLGRGTEMEVQHEKATGKGGLNFILSFQEQMQRPDVLPASLSYEFDQRDEQAEIEEAAVQQAWINVFKAIRETGLQFDSIGGITRQEFRELLAEENIIPKEWTEVEEEVEVTDEDASQIGEGKTLPGEETPAQPTTQPTGGNTGNGSVPIMQEKLHLQQMQKKRMRDILLSKPTIWRAIELFPQEDIVKYQWPEKRMLTVWENAESLLERVYHPSINRKKDELLYKSKDATISIEDVEAAIAQAGEIDSSLQSLLNDQGEWTWNKKAQVYESTSGEILTKAMLNELLMTSKDFTKQTMKAMIEAGALKPKSANITRYTSKDFIYDELKRALKNEYIIQYMAGKGGYENMTHKDWGTLGALLKEQYSYLGSFMEELANSELTEAEIDARLGMYINSAAEAFNRGRGSVIAGMEFDEVRWDLAPIDNHCPGCTKRAEMDFTPIGPRGGFMDDGKECFPGDGSTECLTNCQCGLTYRNSTTGEEYSE